MPRPRTAPFWIDQIRAFVESNPKATLGGIGRHLDATAEAFGIPLTEVPSESTIRRERQAYLALGPEVKHKYQFTFWPESFESGALPWESSSVIGELLRATLPDIRPPLSFAVAFWRVTLAHPTLHISWRRYIALLVWMAPVADGTEAEAIRRIVERMLFGAAVDAIPPVIPSVTITVKGGSLPLFMESFRASGAPVDREAILGWMNAGPNRAWTIQLGGGE